jgi:lysophospholipase L1-like esterase
MMSAISRSASTRAPALRGLFVALFISGIGTALAQVGPGPGGPGGGAAAIPSTPALPAAPVPAVVALGHPSPEELADIKAGLARALDKSDAKTRALVKKYPDLIQVRPPAAINTAIIPQLQGGFIQKHQGNLEVAKQGDANLLFMGDSITDFWRGDRAPYNGKAIQEKYFGQWKVANYGIAGDTTQGVLYRLKDGEGTGIKPKAIMLMIGTNNTGRNSAPEIAEGVGAIVMELQKDYPDARILLLAVFPRGNPGDPVRDTIADINKKIAKLDDGKKVFYMDIGKGFLDANGVIARDIMSDSLHPTEKGYEIWAKAVIEPITAMMNGKAPPGR